jgi:hypothetical protein
VKEVVIIDSSPEYDAFGPWVLPVSTQSEVPPVFGTHPIDFSRASEVLKVPRDVARRDVTPKSHLYDQLLVLTPTDLEVLTRRGHRFSVQRVARSEIVAVRSGAALLDGWLTVLSADGSVVDVRFNGSSLPMMTAFADRLADWIDESEFSGTSQELERDALGQHDVGLVNAYNTVARHRAAFEVITAYPSRMPATRRSRMHRLWHGLPRLSGAVVCSGSGDVVVLSRRTWVQHSSQPDISLSRLVIRVGRITDVSSRDDPFLESCMEVTVHAGAARLEFVVPVDAAPAFAGIRSMTSG